MGTKITFGLAVFAEEGRVADDAGAGSLEMSCEKDREVSEDALFWVRGRNAPGSFRGWAKS